MQSESSTKDKYFFCTDQGKFLESYLGYNFLKFRSELLVENEFDLVFSVVVESNVVFLKLLPGLLFNMCSNYTSVVRVTKIKKIVNSPKTSQLFCLKEGMDNSDN